MLISCDDHADKPRCRTCSSLVQPPLEICPTAFPHHVSHLVLLTLLAVTALTSQTPNLTHVANLHASLPRAHNAGSKASRDGSWLEGDLHAVQDDIIRSRLSLSMGPSRLPPRSPTTRQHHSQTQLPQYLHQPTGQSRSFTVIRTPPASVNGGSASPWHVHSSRPSVSGPPPLQSLQEALDSGGCAQTSLSLNNTRLPSLMGEMTPCVPDEDDPMAGWIGTQSASLPCKVPAGPEGEDGQHAALLIEALTRAGASQPRSRDYRRGSRLLHSRPPSGNFALSVQKGSKGNHTDSSLCGDLSASENQSPRRTFDKGERVCLL